MSEWRAQEPVGLIEIARRLNLTVATVTSMRARDAFPKERGTISKRAPWWYWPDIVKWATKQGLWPPPPGQEG